MLLYLARNYVKCWWGARWGGMLSIRECIEGRYVIIPRTQICKVLEGMQHGEVWLALGSVSRGGMLLYHAHKYVQYWRGARWGGMPSSWKCIKGRYALYPTHKYVQCWRGCKVGRYAQHQGVHKGKYAIIPRREICKVLEGMQDGEVCLAFGSL